MPSFSFPSIFGISILLIVVGILAILGPKLKNSPWLYVAAFGLMSCIGILAIKPKFDKREQGIEMKYVGRKETAKYFAKDSVGDPSTPATPLQIPAPINSAAQSPAAPNPAPANPASDNSADLKSAAEKALAEKGIAVMPDPSVNRPQQSLYSVPPNQNAKTVNFLLFVSGLATVVGLGMSIYTAMQMKPGEPQIDS